MKRSFKVWAISGGPYSREQLEDAYYEEEYAEFPEDGYFLLLCNVEENKKTAAASQRTDTNFEN